MTPLGFSIAQSPSTAAQAVNALTGLSVSQISDVMQRTRTTGALRNFRLLKLDKDGEPVK